MTEEVAIGIDLGTTHSCVGVYHNSKVKIIPNDKGNNITPSCVSFSSRGCLVGDDAKYRLSLLPESTVYDAKRLIGRDYADPNLVNDIQYWPFTVVNLDGKPMIVIPQKPKPFSPEEISSIVLKKLKDIAEDYLGKHVTSAVITVPAYFNESQRQATITAAKLADLNVLRIINEPTAAAMAFSNTLTTTPGGHTDNKTILVYDLGGGTFDVSIINIMDGVYQVVASKGDSHLGGSDFDNNMAEYLYQNYANKRTSLYAEDERSQRLCKVRLRRKCEEAKCSLSRKTGAKIMIDSFYKNKDFEGSIERRQFEALNLDMFKKTIKIVNDVLGDANMTRGAIDEVVLVGGSTRIPKVKELLTEFFRGKELNCSVDPDEAVAYGATIQAAILTKNPDVDDAFIDDICLIDVTPLTMGIAAIGDVMSILIRKNSPIPFKTTERYVTTVDNQSFISVRVHQGESPKATQNHFLGKFTLDNIPWRAAGMVEFDITFIVTADGTLDVSAKQVGGQAENSIRIRNEKLHVSDASIHQMKQDLLSFHGEDVQEKAKIQARNNLESYARWMQHITTNVYKKHKIKDINQTIEWLNTTDATTALYEVKLQHLKNACRKIPAEHQTPGRTAPLSRASTRRLGYENTSHYDNIVPHFGLGGNFVPDLD